MEHVDDDASRSEQRGKVLLGLGFAAGSYGPLRPPPELLFPDSRGTGDHGEPLGIRQVRLPRQSATSALQGTAVRLSLALLRRSLLHRPSRWLFSGTGASRRRPGLPSRNHRAGGAADSAAAAAR